MYTKVSTYTLKEVAVFVVCMLHCNLPIIDEPVNSLLPQLPSVLMVVVVIAPAKHHQTFRLGIPNVGKVLQQLLGVATNPLKEEVQ